MKKNEFQFLSNDSRTRIHVIEWVPDEEPKAVLQLCHGMVEYIDRYDEFARYLAERGYYVVGHDHLGHGQSVQSKEHYGFFHETHGNQYVIGDIHRLRTMTQKKYPDVPYFMLGLPRSLYTPIFAAARIVGWCAHRLEVLKNVVKIIRPAYKSLAPHREYIKMEDR